ncbi:M56 family metallopeptidase [Roseateles sp.]|uniref:M56 family metallopeptidase n=1 Tax=Roseateles sp. TaxID=1971397 RepID=UPI0031DA8B4D
MLELLTGWLLNYLLHSTVLLGGVWALERLGVLKHPAWRELCWRWAFFGAVLTASAQPLLQFSGVGLPVKGLGTSVEAPRNSTTGRDRAVPGGVTVVTSQDVNGAAVTTVTASGEQADAAARNSTESESGAPTSARYAAPDVEASRSTPTPTPTPTATPTPTGETRAADRLAAVTDRLFDLSSENAQRRWEDLRTAVAAFVLAWPLLAAWGLLLTLARWIALRRQVRALPLADDAELQAAAEDLAGRAGVPMPTLRISPLWPSPLVAPGAQICLPATLMRRLEAGQRVAVLAHEIAHLRRRDVAWRLAARLVAHVGWLQPLNRLALRRLDLLAELACDAWAAEEAGAMPLAQGLYVCASDRAAHVASRATRRASRAPLLRWMPLRGAAPMPALASAMAAARSPLMQRMHALLEDAPMSDSPSPAKRRAGRWLLAGGLCAVALAVPMIVIGKVPRISLDIGGAVASLSGAKVTRQVSISNGHERRVSYEGELVFNDEGNELVSLDHQLVVTERTGGVTRKLEVMRDGKDGMTRKYSVDGKSKPIDEEGRRWIAEQLSLVSESAQGSEKRARRLMEKGGVEAVLADVAKAQEPMTRRSRIEGLLATGPQDDATMARLIAMTGDFGGDDFQRRTALIALIEHQALKPAHQREVLRVVNQLHSGFERRTVLVALAPKLAGDREVMAAWQQAVQGVDGDFDKRVAIVALIEEGEAADPVRMRAALDASQLVGGDFDRRTVLEAVSQRDGGVPKGEVARYADAVRGMSSDFDRRVALNALMDGTKVDREVVTQVLRAVDGMSGFDRTEVLTNLASHMPADPALIEQCRKAARGLSTHERGRVEEALDQLTPA